MVDDEETVPHQDSVLLMTIILTFCSTVLVAIQSQRNSASDSEKLFTTGSTIRSHERAVRTTSLGFDFGMILMRGSELDEMLLAVP